VRHVITCLVSVKDLLESRLITNHQSRNLSLRRLGDRVPHLQSINCEKHSSNYRTGTMSCPSSHFILSIDYTTACSELASRGVPKTVTTSVAFGTMLVTIGSMTPIINLHIRLGLTRTTHSGVIGVWLDARLCLNCS